MHHSPTSAERELAGTERGEERVAIVTGASSGIGQASAIALSAAGWKVVLSGRREAELKQTAEKCRWENLVVPGDVSKEEDVKNLFERTIETFGRLDLLFNNAGVSGRAVPIDELSTSDFLSVLNINVVGAFMCAREAFAVFRKEGKGGRIINNASLSAHVPRVHSVAYTVSKHAVAGLTKSLALDGRPFNITATSLDIGNAITSLSTAHDQSSSTTGGVGGKLQPDGSIRREPGMDVQHVADTVVHIASMPVGVAMLTVNIMAAGMPYVGRG